MSTAQETLDSLDLVSLDAESLFQALTNVERALPSLLKCVGPILSELSARPDSSGGDEERDGGARAKESIVTYMALLDVRWYLFAQVAS